jgi:hypothetical protein
MGDPGSCFPALPSGDRKRKPLLRLGAFPTQVARHDVTRFLALEPLFQLRFTSVQTTRLSGVPFDREERVRCFRGLRMWWQRGSAVRVQRQLPALPLCPFGHLPVLTGNVEEASLGLFVSGFLGLFLSFLGASAVLFGSFHGRCQN